MSTQQAFQFHTFDQVVTIVSYAETADGYGGFTSPPTETVVSTEWCSIEFRSGTEALNAGRIVGSADWVIEMWWTASVTLKHVVKLGARVFEILGIDPHGMKNEYMTLYCNEKV
jgi:SPP1 family predicted phage head-tail adaptor